MPRPHLHLAGLACGLVCSALAQEPAALPEPRATSCRPCHTADRPAAGQAGLSPCTRVVPRGTHVAAEGPETLHMNQAGAHYGPVVFSHKAHAEMAEMSMGCIECHHEATEGQRLRPCRECHDPERARAELDRPDLKGAMHRQCLVCHLRWDPGARCSSCHTEQAAGAPAGVPPPGRGVAAPRQLIYDTAATNGPVVTFYHDDHTERFGLACTACHRGQSCASCHARDRVALGPSRRMPRAAPAADAHARCEGCHKDEACASCHAAAPAEPFQHAHTGLVLDENHQDAACSECHEQLAFDKPPTCTACHEDKTYPADTPGARAAAPTAEASP